MFVKIGDSDYKIKFTHLNYRRRYEESRILLIELPQKSTVCEIILVNGEDNRNEVVSKGITYVHPKDQYNKEKGRRLALKKALSEFEKSIRPAFYEVYRTWGDKERWTPKNQLV